MTPSATRTTLGYVDPRTKSYSTDDWAEIDEFLASAVSEAERIEDNWGQTPSFAEKMSALEKRIAGQKDAASKSREKAEGD